MSEWGGGWKLMLMIFWLIELKGGRGLFMASNFPINLKNIRIPQSGSKGKSFNQNLLKKLVFGSGSGSMETKNEIDLKHCLRC